MLPYKLVTVQDGKYVQQAIETGDKSVLGG